MRRLRALFIVALLPFSGQAVATDQVALLPYGTEPERDAGNSKGSWLVCGMKHADSFLSLRQKPSTKSRELQRLSPLTLVSTTGKTRGAGRWIEVNNVGVLFTSDGTFIPNEDDWNRKDVQGWVATRYLCHYGPLPYKEF